MRYHACVMSLRSLKRLFLRSEVTLRRKHKQKQKPAKHRAIILKRLANMPAVGYEAEVTHRYVIEAPNTFDC
jgi:hypothetical protein